MSDFHEKLFKLILGDFAIDMRNGHQENEEIARVTGVSATADVDYLARVMDGMGFHPCQSNEETASAGFLQFSNYIDYEGASITSEDEDDDAESEADIESDDGLDGRGSKHERGIELSNLAIDGDGKNLRVLTDIDSHKFAEKLYSQTLGNDVDRRTYAAFLYAFDNFLFLYKNPNADAEDDAEEASVKTGKLVLNKFIDQFAAFLPQIAPEHAEAETAKEKSARSQVLKALMKLMSGKHGIALTAAWESGDVDRAADAMGNIMEGLLEQMPEPEDEEGEDEGDEGEDVEGDESEADTPAPAKKETPEGEPSDLAL